jgi:cell growth-regulating nucleolar protein
VFRPRADLFFDFVDKGPESERGCSMNKALKRFHRERKAAGTDMTKHMEEKELWRSIRLRRNEQGEIVLFSIES